MGKAGTYDLITDFGANVDLGEISSSPYWIVAVIRLGMPISFSRKKMSSITKDVTAGAILRAEAPLVITDDIFQMQISGSKRSHTKQFSAVLKQTDVNYLVEILPGDYVFAWIVNNETDYENLLGRLEKKEACNKFNDGLKFVGRISSIRKSISVDRGGGNKTSTYSLACTGFEELNTMLFYDHNLASKDVISGDMNQWLARLGLTVIDIFGEATEKGISPNNVNVVIPTLLDLVVGKGPKLDKRSEASITLPGRDGKTVSATPSLNNEAPYSYLIPATVGALLGRSRQEASKPAQILSYADVLELMQGVQEYKNLYKDVYQVFIPSGVKNGNRFVCDQKMLGTFLPLPPAFTNRPLWQIFQQYLNPTINEMYTCLRVNAEGEIMPTLVMRQIPFTTEAFTPDAKVPGSTSSPGGPIPHTKFLTVPRWIVPDTMVSSVDIGRSDATRINFVHIYGQSSLIAKNQEVQTQILENPPIMDSLDIMRSGLRSYMTTVECWIDDQIGSVPGQWMSLVADWTFGSQYTLNGTLVCAGIQSPICEGDNLEFDGVVYHIESVTHSCSIEGGGGNKTWTTTLQLTNGMRADVDFDISTSAATFPIYPGFDKMDNTAYDAGLSLEQRPTSGGPTDTAGAQKKFNEAERQQDLEDQPSQLTGGDSQLPTGKQVADAIEGVRQKAKALVRSSRTRGKKR